MAYSDYGAFVYKNGERRKDKENVALFATDEETFGTSSENIPSGLRIWMSLIHEKESDKSVDRWLTNIHHGIMGDGPVRVMCHKQGLPEIYERLEDGEIKKVDFADEDIDYFDYDSIEYEYKGYQFTFSSNRPYVAEMVEPDGTRWRCEYDYWDDAGF